MQSKSLILLLFALGCGVVASIGITQVMAHRSSDPASPEVETKPIFVVKEDIPLGTLLDAEKLVLEQWPKDKVPEGALGNLEDVEGRRPRTKLFAGEPVLDVKLLSKGESNGGAAPQIPVGYRSVPVKVDEVSGGAAMILPGDRVDVLVYAKEGSSGVKRTMTKTILQDIRVFAVDSQWTLESDESGKSIRAKTISLLLTPEQTERIMLASELGKIRLALRSPNDHEEAELPEEGHQVAQIFGESEMADHEKDSVLGSMMEQPPMIPQPMAMNVSVPGHPSHTVRVISGSEVHEVVMENEAGESVLQGLEASGAGSKNGSAASFLWKIISNPSLPKGNQNRPAVKNAPSAGAEPQDQLNGDADSESDTSFTEPADTAVPTPSD